MDVDVTVGVCDCDILAVEEGVEEGVVDGDIEGDKVDVRDDVEVGV